MWWFVSLTQVHYRRNAAPVVWKSHKIITEHPIAFAHRRNQEQQQRADENEANGIRTGTGMIVTVVDFYREVGELERLELVRAGITEMGEVLAEACLTV